MHSNVVSMKTLENLRKCIGLKWSIGWLGCGWFNRNNRELIKHITACSKEYRDIGRKKVYICSSSCHDLND